MSKLNVDFLKIGIIGGGIVGLSTANIIKKRYPSHHVCVHAEDVLSKTTSWGAAGFCKMKHDDFQENNQLDIKRWFYNGMEYYYSLYRSNEAVQAGVSLLSIYDLFEGELPILDQENKDLHLGFRNVGIKELKTIGLNGRMKHGFYFTCPMVECRYYLPYMTDEFVRLGGEIKEEKIVGNKSDFVQWAKENKYDIVINCSGLGSRWLFEDEKIYSVRGQVIRVGAPWLKFGFMTSDDTYAYPGRDSVVLGGFRQQNDYEKIVRPFETKDVLTRIAEYSPCLAESPILEEWCGLRPTRPGIRVEKETVVSDDYEVPVIHNYGHGARGIALSWGSSLEAVQLVERVIEKL